MNKFLKLLCSIPSILLFLYFIPFIGVCLLLLRNFVYTGKNRITSEIMLVIIGFVILIPKCIDYLFNLLSINKNIIPYFENVINSKTYNVDLINYSKTLIIVGIIFIIISFIFKKIFDRINNFIMSYINKQEVRDAQISQKNYLIMKEKRLKAINTHVVKCSRCGSENMLTEKTGICKYCRNPIE